MHYIVHYINTVFWMIAEFDYYVIKHPLTWALLIALVGLDKIVREIRITMWNHKYSKYLNNQ